MATMKQPELGHRILELRRQKGLTQEELVELCNISVRTLQRIENGEVTPRSYTIKTILSALDEDFEELQKSKAESNFFQLNVKKGESKSVQHLLTLAMVSGVLYLITSTMEGVVDYFRYYEDELIFGITGSVVLKGLSLLFYGLMLYGFLVAGKVLKNYLMKISAILLLTSTLIFYLYDILSFFNDFLAFEAVLFAEAITWGTLGILFGISIIKSPKTMQPISLFAGGMEMLASFLLLTVILALLGWILLLPALILEILFLYKIIRLIKEKFEMS